MKEELLLGISALNQDLQTIENLLKIPQKQDALAEINRQIETIENLYTSPEGTALLKKQSGLVKIVTDFGRLKSLINDCKDLLSIDITDDELVYVQTEINKAQKQIKHMKVEAMFQDEADANDAFLEINSGAGGTESQDWAEMLERMYLRWASSKNFNTEIVSRQQGEEAGIKSVIIKILGHNAYGFVKHETGIHRLVRNSPFNSQGKRQTSFASVYVSPCIDDRIKIEINDKDLKIDTYRSSGAGGQHVNTTDSAVRITHLPTGTVAACQNERSQHQNKARAMEMLKSKLYKLEEEKRKNSQNMIERSDISWGNQIRNYVLQPYRLIKDVRTGFETGNTQAVLDGDIDDLLMEAILKL